MSNQIPIELNSDFDEFNQCQPCKINSTFETGHESGVIHSNSIENLLNQEDDEYSLLNEEMNKQQLAAEIPQSLLDAFQANMSSYVNQQTLTKNSIQMQKEYREANQKEREYVFNTYIKHNVFNLCKDTYMHYVLETILEVGKMKTIFKGPNQYRNWILDQMYQYKEKLLLDLHSCKVMQKGLEIMAKLSNDSKMQQIKFTNFILEDSDFNRKVYTHRIGSQIIQKSLEVFEDDDVNRLLKILNQYILNDNPQKLELSTDQFGCLIVNKIIELHPKLLQKNNQLAGAIINRVIDNSAGLTRRQYANYIIQYLLEKGSEQFKQKLLGDHLINDFIPMSMDKYGSNVAEKAIIHISPNLRQKIWEEQVSVSECSVRKLVNDQFANFPIQRLYLYLSEDYRIEFLNLMNRLHRNNFLNHYGQIVLNFANQNYQVKKFPPQNDTVKNTKQQEKNKKTYNNNKSSNYQQIQQQPSQIQYQQQQINNQQQYYMQQMMMQQYYYQQQQQQQLLYNSNPQYAFMQQQNSQPQYLQPQMKFNHQSTQQLDQYSNVFGNCMQQRRSQRD